MKRTVRYIIPVLTLLMLWAPAFADGSGDGGKDIDIKSMLFGHIGDSYGWHVTKIGDKEITIPLPVIVKSSTGWHCFLSSRLEEGPVDGLYVAEGGKYDGKIVEKDAAGNEVRPLDISITKNVAGLMINSIIVVLLILGCSRWYRKHDVLKEAPLHTCRAQREIRPVPAYGLLLHSGEQPHGHSPGIPGRSKHHRKHSGNIDIGTAHLSNSQHIREQALLERYILARCAVVAESSCTADTAHRAPGDIHKAVCTDDKAVRQYHGRTRSHLELCIHNLPDGQDGTRCKRDNELCGRPFRDIHGFPRTPRGVHPGLCVHHAFSGIHRPCTRQD